MVGVGWRVNVNHSCFFGTRHMLPHKPEHLASWLPNRNFVTIFYRFLTLQNDLPFLSHEIPLRALVLVKMLVQSLLDFYRLRFPLAACGAAWSLVLLATYEVVLLSMVLQCWLA